jgi:hypothetical protein
MTHRYVLTAARAAQRGAGALAVMMLLLFSTSIVAFYLNRDVLFEQKVSASQVRATSAFEVAEAGIEWATGMLNSPYDINTSCGADPSTNASFRDKYLLVGGAMTVTPATTTFPGCKINGTALTCSCPALPAAGGESVASLGTTSQPGFTVSFEAVSVNGAPDPQAVRVTSTGCTATTSACKPLTAGSAATTGSGDAWAQVSVILKVRPLMRAAPAAALTCGTSCQLGGSYNISNTDLGSNGMTINAGTAITSGGGVSVSTLPGQPVGTSQVANDTALSSIASADADCSDSSMFQAYFGTTLAEYISSPQVRSIPGCTDPGTCGALIQAAVEAGYTDLYFPDGLSLNNSAPFSTLGAPGAGNGVNIISPSTIDINGNISIYGMVFSNSAVVNDVGTGTANIYGAMVTCAGYRNNGNGTLSYNPDALTGGAPRGTLVRVPGSWRDFTP